MKKFDAVAFPHLPLASDQLVQKELKSFFALLESLRSSFRTWTSQIKEILGLQDNDVPNGLAMDEQSNENIHQEFVKMQQEIVSGRLLCSKEEAATLAAVQLRLESWPEENLDLAEGSFSAEDKVHRLHFALNNESNSGVTSLLRSFSAIVCCKQLDSSNPRAKKPFLPPNLRHSNEICKLIKVGRRKNSSRRMFF